jgi:hypothetical protein
MATLSPQRPVRACGRRPDAAGARHHVRRGSGRCCATVAVICTARLTADPGIGIAPGLRARAGLAGIRPG